MTLTSGPEWLLHYWSWEKGKIIASVRIVTTSEKLTLQQSAASGAQSNTPAPQKDNAKENLTFGSAAYQVSINPADGTQICCIGSGIFRLFRYQEGVMKALGSQKIEQKVRIMLYLSNKISEDLLFSNGQSRIT